MRETRTSGGRRIELEDRPVVVGNVSRANGEQVHRRDAKGVNARARVGPPDRQQPERRVDRPPAREARPDPSRGGGSVYKGGEELPQCRRADALGEGKVDDAGWGVRDGESGDRSRADAEADNAGRETCVVCVLAGAVCEVGTGGMGKETTGRLGRITSGRQVTSISRNLPQIRGRYDSNVNSSNSRAPRGDNTGA